MKTPASNRELVGCFENNFIAFEINFSLRAYRRQISYDDS